MALAQQRVSDSARRSRNWGQSLRTGSTKDEIVLISSLLLPADMAGRATLLGGIEGLVVLIAEPGESQNRRDH